MTLRDCSAILMAPHCAACQRPKALKMAFCANCFKSLPYELRQALYRRFGEGFEAAYDGALGFLARQGAERAYGA